MTETRRSGARPSDDGEVRVRVRYAGADEWYAVSGGQARLVDPADAEAVHRLVLGILGRGGPMDPASAGWTPETA